jgi:hypothetical protein
VLDIKFLRTVEFLAAPPERPGFFSTSESADGILLIDTSHNILWGTHRGKPIAAARKAKCYHISRCTDCRHPRMVKDYCGRLWYVRRKPLYGPDGKPFGSLLFASEIP